MREIWRNVKMVKVMIEFDGGAEVLKQILEATKEE